MRYGLGLSLTLTKSLECPDTPGEARIPILCFRSLSLSETPSFYWAYVVLNCAAITLVLSILG